MPSNDGTNIYPFPSDGGDPKRVANGGEPPHDGGMEARVAKLETCFEYVQRDLSEVRTDARAIYDRLGSIDSKLSGMSERMDRFPTKLQLSLWAGGGLLALLGIAAALIALLLRLSGHATAADAVDAARGK